MASQHEQIKWSLPQDYLDRMNRQNSYKARYTGTHHNDKSYSREQYMDMIQFMMNESASAKQVHTQEKAKRALLQQNKQDPPQLPNI